ncbi:uncharacterized protein DS421_14g475570 [Arachis hypogaea]|nr:uncharacterized protein DS421_14g475570 [Arachis hypogaea]
MADDILSYKFTKKIWKDLVPPKVELFSWFVLVGRVNTKERLSRLGIIKMNDNICVLCKKDVEIVLHLFATCEYSWQVWCAWIKEFGRKWTIPNTLKDHFESWRTMLCTTELRKCWQIGFFSILWNIWLCRNDVIFENKTTDVPECVARSFCSAKDWCDS